MGCCEDRVLDGPASGGKGSKGGNWLDCIRGKDVSGPHRCFELGGGALRFASALRAELAQLVSLANVILEETMIYAVVCWSKP